MAQGLVYFILKTVVGWALRFYLGRYQTTGGHHVPAKGPVIFAVNHQNAFLDAILVTTNLSRNPYFLARASAFKYRWSAELLGLIRLMPIYRIRDGLANVKKNDGVIDASINLLLKGNSLMIFPEGNHAIQYCLRPIQKGIARIAIGAVQQSGATPDLTIIPVGIQYEHYAQVGTEVLISYGPPIEIADYKPGPSQDDRVRAYGELCSKLYSEMSGLIVNIGPPDRYEEIYRRWQESRLHEPDLIRRLAKDQEMVKSMATTSESAKRPPDRRTYVVRQALAWILLTLVRAIFLLPFLVIRGVCFWVREKAPEFEGSVKFILWLIFGPAYVALIVVGLWMYSGSLEVTSGAAVGLVLLVRLAIINRRYLA